MKGNLTMANKLETVDLSTLTNNEYSIESGAYDYVFNGITNLNQTDKITLNFSDDGLIKSCKKLGNTLKFDYSYESYDEESAEPITITQSFTVNNYFKACNQILISANEHTEPLFKFDYFDDAETGSSINVYGSGTVYGTNQGDTIHTDVDENGNKIVSDDIIYTGDGNDFVYAGQGNDIIYFDKTKGSILDTTMDSDNTSDNIGDSWEEENYTDKTLIFNMGDGNDTIYLDGADNIYLNFESVRTAGLGEEEFQKQIEEWEQNPDHNDEDYPSPSTKVLSYKRSGDDLIITSPTLEENINDTVTLKGFYNSNNTANIYFNNDYDTIDITNLKDVLDIYSYIHNDKSVEFKGEKTIDIAAIIEEGESTLNINDGKYNYIINGTKELTENFSLDLVNWDADTAKYADVSNYTKVGNDLRMNCTFLFKEYENEYADLEVGTILYETENGYSLKKPSTEDYSTYTITEDDYFYFNALTGELTGEEFTSIYKDFTVTIKDYFSTNYINEDKLLIDIDGQSKAISSVLKNESLIVIGNGDIYGSDLNDDIYTDEDENRVDIVSNDIIHTGKGDDSVTAGKGNDTIYLDKGEKDIYFHMGDGKDVIYLNGADTLTLNFESVYTGGLGYDNYDYNIAQPDINILSYKRNGDDLIIESPSLTNKKDTITIKDYFNENNLTNIKISAPGTEDETIYSNLKDILDSYGEIPPFVQDIEYTKVDCRVFNKKGVEVAKADKIVIGQGDYSVFAGKGNDTITLDEGNMMININKGDGIDTVNLNGTTSLTLNFESVNTENIDVLSLQKQGDDLVVISPSGTKKDDSVIIKNYFASTNTTEIYIGDGKDNTELDNLIQEGIILAGSSKANNTFVDSEYNEIINGGNKVDNITLYGNGKDIVNLNAGNDVIKFNDLYKDNNSLSITTGKGTKTVDVTEIDNAEITVTRSDSDLKLGFNVEGANDVVIDDYFKSGAVLSLKDKTGTRTLKYGAGKVSGTKGDDIVFASADKKGKTTVSTLAGDDNITVDVQKGSKITVSSGDGNDYIYLNTEKLGSGGKDSFTANLNGGKGNDTYNLSDVDLTKGKIVVNMADGSDNLVLSDDTRFGGYSSTTSDFSYEHTINNGNSIITNNYRSFDYSNDLTLFFDVKLDKRGVSYGYSRTGDLFLVKGADMELADGKVDRGIQLSGISEDDSISIGNSSYSFDNNTVGRLMSDVASWLSENDYVSTADVFKTGDVNDIHTLIDMYATGTNQCFVQQ